MKDVVLCLFFRSFLRPFFDPSVGRSVVFSADTADVAASVVVAVAAVSVVAAAAAAASVVVELV